MKIIIFGNPKGSFTKLAETITLKGHECIVMNKLENITADEYVQSVITEPDIVICVDNYVTWEDLQLMGITNHPIRCLYVTGAPAKRGGIARTDWRYRDFNKYFFGQTELDRRYFTFERENVITQEMETIEIYPDLQFLPFPVDTDGIQQATLSTTGLVIGHTQSAMSHAGAYSKGFDFLLKLHNEIGVSVKAIFGKTKEGAIAEKATCNLIFDNPWGNVGNTGLESLAQGLPVIGRFHPVVYENWSRLSGQEPPLITFTHYEDLKTTISGYVQDLSQLSTIGQSSRLWAENNLTMEKIAEYWISKLSSLTN